MDMDFTHEDAINAMMAHKNCTREEALIDVERYQGQKPSAAYISGWLDGRHHSIQELIKDYNETRERILKIRSDYYKSYDD